MVGLEAHRRRLQERAIATVHDGDLTPVVDIQDAARALNMSANDSVSRDEFARHEVWDREQEGRIVRLESCVERQEKTLEKLTDQTRDIHKVVTNGLKDRVMELAQAVTALTAKQPMAKKPRRLEILLAVMVVLSALSAVGLFDALRQGLASWFTGG